MNTNPPTVIQPRRQKKVMTAGEQKKRRAVKMATKIT
jgi:hypothetical protein